VGENYRTSADTLKETVQQFLLPLLELSPFHVNYAVVDGFDPRGRRSTSPSDLCWTAGSCRGWPGWSRLSIPSWRDYDVTGAARPIAASSDDLSKWVLRGRAAVSGNRSRTRTEQAAYQTLHTTLTTVAQLLAPFTPSSATPSTQPLWRPQRAPSRLPERRRGGVRPKPRGPDGRGAARSRGRKRCARWRAHQGAPAAALDAVPGEPLSEEIAMIIREELNVKSLPVPRQRGEARHRHHRGLKLEAWPRARAYGQRPAAGSSGFNVEDRIHARLRGGRYAGRAIESTLTT